MATAPHARTVAEPRPLRARLDYWFWRGLTASVFGAALALCILNPGAH